MDLYFARHDGQAVTTDHFFAAMTDANGGNDISRLKKWYTQAGTPTLKCARSYDAAAQTYSLTLEQVLPKTPDMDGAKTAQLIPVTVGLIGAGGADLALGDVSVSGEEGGEGSAATVTGEGAVVLRLNAMKATFTFKVARCRFTPGSPRLIAARESQI